MKSTPWRKVASRGAATTAALLTTAVMVLTPSVAGATPNDAGAPEIVGADSPSAIPGEYIVVLKPQQGIGAAEDVAEALTDEVGGRVLGTFNAAFHGYSARLNERAAEALARNDRVEYVEQAQQVYALAEQVSPPNWGDDRIDQRDLPLNGKFAYPDSAGEGVNVYIVDTGIRSSHAEFAGRIRPGYDAITPGGAAQDCNGHGTHVAGTAVGSTYGVAKKATVYPVRILNCEGSGSTTDIIEAIEWLTENAVHPATANYSVGCRSACSSPATDQAVRNLVASGVTWVQAAGNSNDDACRYSPQLVPEGITVGNSTRTDAKAASSSWGRCLDVWAPGSSIVSSYHTGDSATATLTGTSMASPHVTGATALYLGENPDATPAQVQAALVDNATTGKLTGLDSTSPNRLLYTGFLGSTTPPNPGSVDLAAIADQSGTVGTAVNLAVSASGGVAPYAFSATGLPAGLSINASTGAITGTPTAAATSSVTVTVRDSAGTPTTDSASFTWTVAAAPTSTCTGTKTWTGTLSDGQQQGLPSFTDSGSIEVCLDGPTGTDFDIYLQKRSWYGWSTVARGTSVNPDEKFTYNGTSGTYRLVAVSYTGSGAYTASVK